MADDAPTVMERSFSEAKKKFLTTLTLEEVLIYCPQVKAALDEHIKCGISPEAEVNKGLFQNLERESEEASKGGAKSNKEKMLTAIHEDMPDEIPAGGISPEFEVNKTSFQNLECKSGEVTTDDTKREEEKVPIPVSEDIADEIPAGAAIMNSSLESSDDMVVQSTNTAEQTTKLLPAPVADASNKDILTSKSPGFTSLECETQKDDCNGDGKDLQNLTQPGEISHDSNNTCKPIPVPRNLSQSIQTTPQPKPRQKLNSSNDDSPPSKPPRDATFGLTDVGQKANIQNPSVTGASKADANSAISDHVASSATTSSQPSSEKGEFSAKLSKPICLETKSSAFITTPETVVEEITITETVLVNSCEFSKVPDVIFQPNVTNAQTFLSDKVKEDSSSKATEDVPPKPRLPRGTLPSPKGQDASASPSTPPCSLPLEDAGKPQVIFNAAYAMQRCPSNASPLKGDKSLCSEENKLVCAARYDDKMYEPIEKNQNSTISPTESPNGTGTALKKQIENKANSQKSSKIAPPVFPKPNMTSFKDNSAGNGYPDRLQNDASMVNPMTVQTNIEQMHSPESSQIKPLARQRRVPESTFDTVQIIDETRVDKADQPRNLDKVGHLNFNPKEINKSNDKSPAKVARVNKNTLASLTSPLSPKSHVMVRSPSTQTTSDFRPPLLKDNEDGRSAEPDSLKGALSFTKRSDAAFKNQLKDMLARQISSPDGQEKNKHLVLKLSEVADNNNNVKHTESSDCGNRDRPSPIRNQNFSRHGRSIQTEKPCNAVTHRTAGNLLYGGEQFGIDGLSFDPAIDGTIWSLCIDRDVDKLYVLAEREHHYRVHAINMDNQNVNQTIITFESQFDEYMLITFDQILVTNYMHKCVAVYSKLTNALMFNFQSAHLNSPRGMTQLKYGRVLICDIGNETLWCFKRITPTATPDWKATGFYANVIAVDDQKETVFIAPCSDITGKIFALDADTGEVQKVIQAGRGQILSMSAFENELALARGAAGIQIFSLNDDHTPSTRETTDAKRLTVVQVNSDLESESEEVQSKSIEVPNEHVDEDIPQATRPKKSDERSDEILSPNTNTKRSKRCKVQ